MTDVDVPPMANSRPISTANSQSQSSTISRSRWSGATLWNSAMTAEYIARRPESLASDSLWIDDDFDPHVTGLKKGVLVDPQVLLGEGVDVLLSAALF